MKKPCKECPHLIRNRHNDMIVDFGKRTNKRINIKLGFTPETYGKEVW